MRIDMVVMTRCEVACAPGLNGIQPEQQTYRSRSMLSTLTLRECIDRVWALGGHGVRNITVETRRQGKRIETVLHVNNYDGATTWYHTITLHHADDGKEPVLFTPSSFARLVAWLRMGFDDAAVTGSEIWW